MGDCSIDGVGDLSDNPAVVDPIGVDDDDSVSINGDGDSLSIGGDADSECMCVDADDAVFGEHDADATDPISFEFMCVDAEDASDWSKNNKNDNI